MNTIIIKGRICKDIELRTTNNGKHVCAADVAVDRGYGEHKATDFFSCVFWEKAAEFVSKYFRKGQEILVSGEMQSRKYEDKSGNKRTAWEIGNARAEFCGSKSDSQQASQQSNADALESRMENAGFVETGDDEELPF